MIQHQNLFHLSMHRTKKYRSLTQQCGTLKEHQHALLYANSAQIYVLSIARSRASRMSMKMEKVALSVSPIPAMQKSYQMLNLMESQRAKVQLCTLRTRKRRLQATTSPLLKLTIMAIETIGVKTS